MYVPNQIYVAPSAKGWSAFKSRIVRVIRDRVHPRFVLIIHQITMNNEECKLVNF